MPERNYQTKEEVVAQANIILNKTLRDIIPAAEISVVESKIAEYGSSRKGFLGDLVEKYVFGLDTNSRSEADFVIAGVELKTTPLKEHVKKTYVSKERLVFSMIDYAGVVGETWETSSFLKKNSLLLLMFYLYFKEQGLLDYEFKFIHLLELLKDISVQDIAQIKKDWEFIVDKIKRGEAHLLSEGDTYYLGACTKAKNNLVFRDQPHSAIKAKPRAFSLKQTYLNYLIQRRLMGRSEDASSIFKEGQVATINDVVEEKFRRFIGKTDKEICEMLGWEPGENKPKGYKRLLANYVLVGTGSNDVEELDKANITLKAVALESDGSLKESISFPAFNYEDLVNQVWFDEENETMADFHAQLEMQRFLFVVFQKVGDTEDVVLKKIKFWNFPMADIDKAKDVWDKTFELISDGKIVEKVVEMGNGEKKRYTYFPGTTFNGVAHVRPHGANSADVAVLPVADKLTGEKVYTKHCFWLNADYIKKALED